ncbi:hypothetical protein FRACYDRAFT_237556 [Fragilariopsis cylindrus CCMP1102]|uniref:RING-type domain-containing protein n=1 Tax=Fragilariopsis cylindrus CCMP1102 TaxID=635003 RepID=A0A1E7FG72_9STRA|nr:hypothetical protein FRACYDRAFT_237556 [Fragilariopsis cylindrus CCMP1102]|eukprot:OEU17146.1 hypothetical protein FRACYDRAFT_237556 [Fragilariopsis cylindrus CCMP1102]
MEHSSVLDIADSISPSPSSSSSSSSKDDGTIPWNDQIGLLLFFVTTIISIFFLVVYSTRSRKFCSLRRRQGGGGQGGGNRQDGRRYQNSQQQQQQLTDRVLAEELQRRLNEEERERDRLAKRKDRRMWYEYYMKPCSMIIENSDLFYALDEEFVESKEPQLYQQHRGEQEEENDDDIDDNDNDNDNDIVEPVIVVCQQKMEKISKNITDDEFVDSDDEEISESGKKQKSSQFVLCDEHNENATLYVSLPAAVGKKRNSCAGAGANVSFSVSDSGGENIISRRRCVDGTCALCIDEYEEGDMVVWSDLQCSHAFHKECLMQWLSKGKKRCPICRHWFVPGAKIGDQKIAHGEAWQRSLKEMEMEQREDEEEKNRKRLAALLSQKEKSLPNNEKLDETTVDIKLGDAGSKSTMLHQYSLDLEYMGISGSVDMSELDIENQQIVRPSNSDNFLAVQNSMRDDCNQDMASKDAESNFERSEVFSCDEFN